MSIGMQNITNVVVISIIYEIIILLSFVKRQNKSYR